MCTVGWVQDTPSASSKMSLPGLNISALGSLKIAEYQGGTECFHTQPSRGYGLNPASRKKIELNVFSE